MAGERRGEGWVDRRRRRGVRDGKGKKRGEGEKGRRMDHKKMRLRMF